MPVEFHRTLKNDLGQLGDLITEVATFLAPFDLSMRTDYAVNLAVEELILNIISYAYETPGVCDIHFLMLIDDVNVGIVIEDFGKPFNPLEKEAPDTSLPIDQRDIGGLGIHLVRNIFDSMTYRREGDKNVLELSIRRQAA